MKSSALLRLTALLGLWMLLVQPTHAGSLNAVLGEATNDPNTPNDDMLIQVPLHWYPGARVQFYYSTEVFTGQALAWPSVDIDSCYGFLRDPYDVTAAVNRALVRWNKAMFADSRKFTLNESLINVGGNAGIINLPLPDSNQTYSPSSVAADGFNFIDFRYGSGQGSQGGTPFGNNSVAATIVSYFTRDFPLEQFIRDGVPGYIVQAVNNSNQTYVIVDVTQLNGGVNNQVTNPSVPVYIPLRDYKQGEIFDVDIALNYQESDNFRPWPENIQAIPAQWRPSITQTFDIEAMFMHEFGWALGLGNSMIFDSVMYPYINRERWDLTNPPEFITDQFRKRLLSFDDQITAGIAWNATFPTTLGAISGQVLDGATVGANTPINATNTQNQNGTGATGNTGNTGNTGTQTPTPTTAPQDPFIAQVPVFVGVKASEVASMPKLLTGDRPDYLAIIKGRASSAENHADNIVSQPSLLFPGDPNQGKWRMLAQVMTGQNVGIPASQGTQRTNTGNNTGSGTPGAGGESGGTGGGATGNTGNQTGIITEPGPDNTILTQVSNINSLYLIPGLPDRDITGQPINYAVYLPSRVRFNGGLTNANGFYLNQFQQDLIASQPTAFYTYPNEFYGGVDIPLQFGRGDAPLTMIANDDQFESNYIIGEMDPDGRIAAAINQGPTLLSGYRMGPQSFVVLSDKDTYYSNKSGPIARLVEPVVVKDPPVALNYNGATTYANSGNAAGAWQQDGKFRLRTEVKLSSQGGMVGIPAGIEVIHTITNLSSSATTYTLRQVLDTNIFGRENPVYMVNGKYVDYSTSYRGSKIPQEIVFQSWSNPETAIRGFIDLKGGSSISPSWVTIGTIAELNRILPGPGAQLTGMNSMSIDSGVALGWDLPLAGGEQRVVRFIVGYYPGGQVNDSWYPLPATLTVGTQLSGFEDDPNKILPVQVKPGKITDGIDIYTNTYTGTAVPTAVQHAQEGSATGLLQFIRLASGFPDYRTYYTVGGALGDLDNDGDLDVVTCAVNGNNPGAGAVTRIYLNEQRINSDGSVSRYFRDVTLGDNPNDPASYRLQPLHQGEDSYGVVLADFDDDGWLEIFVTHRFAPNRYYDNLGPDKPAYFVEDTEALPGLLNAPWNDPAGYDFPCRAVAGDIDCDGDLDLIISQIEPFWPTYVGGALGGLTGYNAWIDGDSSTGTGDPRGDSRMSHSRDEWCSWLMYSERVLINYKYTPEYARRFNDLHGMTGQDRTDQMGTYFVDETLGTDDRPGTLSSLVTGRYDNLWQYQYVVSWDPSEIDRMPPVFPNHWTYNDQNLQPSGLVTSPMGYNAIEPRLGQLFGGTGLDLMSVRVHNTAANYASGSTLCVVTTPLPNAQTGDPGYIGLQATYLGGPAGQSYGTDSAFFRNVDLFSNTLSTGSPMEVVGDGIPDGYFACMNYNMDYGVLAPPMVTSQASSYAGGLGTLFNAGPNSFYGLFVYEEDRDTSSNRALLRYDAYPLMIGIPEADANDVKGELGGNQSDFSDIVTPARAGMQCFAGVIADWENRGHPMPLMLPHNDQTMAPVPVPWLYTFTDDGPSDLFEGNGISRGFSYGGNVGHYNGLAPQYWEQPTYPFAAYSYYDGSAGHHWYPRDIGGNQAGDSTPAPIGQPYGAASGDFDRDGDEDLFFVNSSTSGVDGPLVGTGLGYIAPKALKQLFVNNSFGVFRESTNSLVPNEPVNGMYCAVGDLDNDADLDLVSFNMLGPNEAYINQAFTGAPNPLDSKDPSMFYDATYSTIPDIHATVMFGPQETQAGFTGVTLNAAVADLNSDGRPDLMLAEGGKYTRYGDFARVLMNGGKPVGDGVRVFKPAGAAYPGPRQDLWVHNLIDAGGVYTQLGDVKIWDNLFGQRPSEMPYGFFFDGYMGGPNTGFITDVVPGDVDGDGDSDVLIVRSGAPTNMVTAGPQLLINNDADNPGLNNIPDPDSLGDGVFSDGSLVQLIDPTQTATTGNMSFKQQGQKAKFADFNHDGFQDIVIANGFPDDQSGRGAPNVLLLNTREMPGHFTDVTESALPTVTEGDVKRGIYDNTLDVVVGDFDADGDVDIIFGNDVPDNPASAETALGFRLLLNDGNGHFTDTPQGKYIPTFATNPKRHVKGMAVADIDGLGEPTEDKNHNGALDPGEDANHNGVIDWVDLPSETEDLNGNGVLDPGEDVGIGPSKTGANNGKLDYQDLNNDGIITARRQGIWDGSLDVVVSFDNAVPAVLINDPTGQRPGHFTEESSLRLDNAKPTANRGLDIGDINLDGYPDIVIAQFIGGITTPVTVWLNQPKIEGGKVKWGYFKDVSYEVPYPRAEAQYIDVSNNLTGVDDYNDTGWAHDVKLLDMDGDGDLDMFVATAANPNHNLNVGALDFMYVNRVIGDGFAFKGYERAQAQWSKTSPSVYSIEPHGAKRGTLTDVTLTGANLGGSTMLSFGSGVKVKTVTPVDSNNIRVTLDVEAAAPLGPRSVLVQNPSGASVASKVGLFNIYDKALNEVPDRMWSIYN